MAYYLVRAKPNGNLEALRRRLDSGEIQAMRPFGTALDYSLRHARRAADGYAVWEEEDYCTPPLNAERNAVLDTYFTDLSVEPVQAGAGWAKISNLPPLWRD